jgi:hypothetical protein
MVRTQLPTLLLMAVVRILRFFLMGVRANHSYPDHGPAVERFVRQRFVSKLCMGATFLGPVRGLPLLLVQPRTLRASQLMGLSILALITYSFHQRRGALRLI